MDNSNPVTSSKNDTAEVILNLESLIKNHDANIEKLKIELKKHKEMLADILANDPTYKLHEQKAKEANKVKLMTRMQILKRPDSADLVNKMKNIQSEIKELSASLSDYLREYARLSGSNEIEGEDGEVREIVYVAKLVKKKSKSRF